MIEKAKVLFLPVRRAQRAVYTVISRSGVSPFADIVRRVTEAGERLRAARIARKVAPMAEYRRK